jgi:hypothetical protein
MRNDPIRSEGEAMPEEAFSQEFDKISIALRDAYRDEDLTLIVNLQKELSRWGRTASDRAPGTVRSTPR